MNEDGYYQASVSENCHADHIIDTAHKCKDAALVLGLKYGGVHNNDEYPAGCYWNSVTGHVTEANLNQITDPSQTKPGFLHRTPVACCRGRFAPNPIGKTPL